MEPTPAARGPRPPAPTGPERNIRLIIEYEGTRYAGWQVQKTARTVAGEILAVIERTLGEQPQLLAAGRTDQGVHAEAQVANFLTRTTMVPKALADLLNDALPADINVLRADEVPLSFHARHDAIARRYRYQIAERRTAFFKKLVWWIRQPLDLAAMEQAATALVGRHDFSSYSDRSEELREPRVKVHTAALRRSDFLLTFTIEADHFLPRMVRRIVGVLVQIGQGRLPVEAVQRFIKEQVNDPAQWTAPSSGLLLEKVIYPSARPPTPPRKEGSR